MSIVVKWSSLYYKGWCLIACKFMCNSVCAHQSTFFSSLVPGKPPENMNVTIINPKTLQVSWSSVEKQQIVNTWGLKVNYQANDNKTHSILVEKHQEEANISQLQPDTTYTIWAVPVTSKGFGFSSHVHNVTTPYRGNSYYQYYLETKGSFQNYRNTLMPSVK